jgi:ABC-type glycerol-3-phosphate transport system permease component
VRRATTAGSRHLFLVLASLLVLSPLVMMLITALKSNKEYAANAVGIPSNPTLENVKTVLDDPHLATWLTNSVIITAGSVALAAVVSLLAAYPIARASGRWPGMLIPLLILLIAVPPVVLVVPLFIVMDNLGLLNSKLGVIITYSGLLTPLSTYLLVGFIRGIPSALDEAAMIDGAGRGRVLLFVLLPLMRPALVTVGVVGSVYVWNEFLIALLFLQSQGSQTIMVGIASLEGRYGINETLLAAWSLIASVPIVVAYLFGQRFLVRGLVSGALR